MRCPHGVALPLAVSLSADPPACALTRLLGQHPAAIRKVRWDGPESGQTSRDYLEIETKHGRVVVIDPSRGTVSADPPLPPGIPTGAVRIQQDLTEAVPSAFDGRPVFSLVSAQQGDQTGWHFQLSTGVLLTLAGGDLIPVTSRPG